ncbi:Gfo/Idh/MocA family oxidoreductase [Candidatus Sumerlaeota bacterium]|nr:Gfo/Idh/MocA family oxidoreductase [Candidatus Sumerlaeota bacterium]
MDHPIKTAVIGVGSLGQHHARNYAANPDCELVAVVDTDEKRAQTIAKTNKTEACTDYRELIGKIQAASVVVPTVKHFEIAKELLESGIHVLVEKPITKSVEEAHELIQIAKANNRILQVGHIERFNAPIMELRQIVDRPAFIEAHRLGPFDPRVQDIGVVLDLMIHDLDIIRELVGESRVVSIDAVGVSVFTQYEDIANARLHFENGCIANITASRVTPKKQRKIRLFQEDTYISIDCAKPSMEIYTKEKVTSPRPGEMPVEVIRKRKRLKKEEPLKVEISHFLDCVEKQQKPQIDGVKARDALQLAVEITEQIRAKKDVFSRSAITL